MMARTVRIRDRARRVVEEMGLWWWSIQSGVSVPLGML